MINIAKFNYKIQGKILDDDVCEPFSTVWRKVFLYLKKKGYDVLSPGQEINRCLKPYIVLKEGPLEGYMGSGIIGTRTLDIIIVMPKDSYSKLSIYIEILIKDLKCIKSLIKFTGDISSINIEPDIDAYIATLKYKSHQRIGGR